MSFFDSKEEVINVELTSYGKLLLSKGMLKPSYYSFHDDDIIYDSAYAGVETLSSKNEIRIQEETPCLKPFYSFTSPKSNIEKELDQINFINSINNLNIYKVDYFDSSLGNSTITNLYSPAWNISNLSVNFNSISPLFGNKNLKIPQLECTLTSSFYRIKNEALDLSQELNNIIREKTFQINYFSDDTFGFCDSQELVLKIEELNADVEFDKFDVEIFKIEYDNDNNETYKLLKFFKDINFVDNNNMLINTVEIINPTDTEDSYVNNWLDVQLDKRINESIVCKHIKKNNSDKDNMFVAVNCDNIQTRFTTDELYEIINTATGKNC